MRKQRTREEKIAMAEKRIENLKAGIETGSAKVQIPFDKYLSVDGGVLKVKAFPAKIERTQLYCHVTQGESKFKVFLRKSAQWPANVVIPKSARPTVEFPDGAAWKESGSTFYGSIGVQSEEKQSVALVIGLLAKEVEKLETAHEKQSAELDRLSAKASKK